MAEQEEISEFIGYNFGRAEKLCLSLHQNKPDLMELVHKDFCFFAMSIFSGSVKSGLLSRFAREAAIEWLASLSTSKSQMFDLKCTTATSTSTGRR